jgi:hypothetical protein
MGLYLPLSFVLMYANDVFNCSARLEVQLDMLHHCTEMYSHEAAAHRVIIVAMC